MDLIILKYLKMFVFSYNWDLKNYSMIKFFDHDMSPNNWNEDVTHAGFVEFTLL